MTLLPIRQSVPTIARTKLSWLRIAQRQPLQRAKGERLMLITDFLSRLPAFACALGLTSAIVLRTTKSTEAQTMKPTILLVHGAWADSSGWNGVVDLLLEDGYDVRALPNTLRGLEADAAVISTYLKTVSGPVVLVGHSYGG